MKHSRTLSWLLLSALLISLASCGGAASGNDTTAADGTTEPVVEVDPLMPTETKDFGGRKFRILSSEDLLERYIWAEEENGNGINDALYQRTRMTEEQLNVDIDCELVPTINDTYPKLKASVMAGDNDYDLVNHHVNMNLTDFVADNLIMDWSTVPHVDFSKPYWNSDIIESLSINGKSPYADGDINIVDTVFMLYNKSLAADLKLGNLYDYVFDGTWTWDKLIKLSADVKNDINGDSKFDYNDRFGCVVDTSSSRWLLRNVPGGCGETVYQNDKDGLRLTVNVDRIQPLVEKICGLFSDGGGYVLSQKADSRPATPDLFNQGNWLTLFSSTAGTAYNYNNLSFDYGVLPLPKYDEKQNDYICISWCNNLMIPALADADLVGMVTEWLAYYSYKIMRPAFYDSLLSVKFAQDEETVRILNDYIFANIRYDPGMNFKSPGFYDYFDYLVVNNNTGFTSFYASKLSAEEAYLTKLNEAFANFGK